MYSTMMRLWVDLFLLADGLRKLVTKAWGGRVAYRATSPFLEALEARVMPVVDFWKVDAPTKLWSDPDNWSKGVPLSTYDVMLQGEG